MEGIFQEFENENSLRSYPFASGCVPASDDALGIPPGVFVDAMIYPVNPSGVLYMSEVSADGAVSVSDDTGVVMTGVAHGRDVVFTDVSPFSRHVGTLSAASEEALSRFLGRGVDRSYSAENAAFAASCVFPVVVDGVVSVSVGDAGEATGKVAFSNGPDDEVRASSARLPDGRRTLRFDVLSRPQVQEADYIRKIICVADGQTPFRIGKLAYNVILVTLPGLDRDAVCSAAHREDTFEMSDTCGCGDGGVKRMKQLPEYYWLEEVSIPPDAGRPDGADNAFYLVSSNVPGYVNPISITLEDGEVSPNTEGVEVVSDGGVMRLEDGALTDKVSSKSVVIQIPGLSGGAA